MLDTTDESPFVDGAGTNTFVSGPFLLYIFGHFFWEPLALVDL